MAFFHMEENYMSSFLDSTGLSELANKLKSYFCKQDGSYTSLNSGGLLVTNENIVSVYVKSNSAQRLRCIYQNGGDFVDLTWGSYAPLTEIYSNLLTASLS
jgi:hypothetical protein